MIYRKYKIVNDVKVRYMYNRLGGNWVTENKVLKRLNIIGPFVDSRRFWYSIKKCKEYIDYLYRISLIPAKN